MDPTIGRFVLDAPILPPLTDTIRIAEAFRDAAMGCFRNWCEQNETESAPFRLPSSGEYASSLLSGKDHDGNPLIGHGHAWYLPVPDEHDCYAIAEVIIIARDGIGWAEREALSSLRYISTGGNTCLDTFCTGFGTLDDLPECIAGPSLEWRSMTPFLGHSKIGTHARQKYLRKGLRREWKRQLGRFNNANDRELVHIHEISPDDVAMYSTPRPDEFVRARRRTVGTEASRIAAMFHLVFSKPVHGPVLLGYASHFGMGMFTPITGKPGAR